MTTLRRILISMLVLALFAGAAWADDRGSISGHVTDKRTGHAIPFASIAVIGAKTGGLTDSEGAFTIKGVPVGTYEVKVQYLGYKPASNPGVIVTAGKAVVVDFKIEAKGDSGIYLKATPQVQVWDFTEAAGYWKLGADKGSGGLWNNAAGSPGKDPLVLADKPIGEWNTFKIRQLGDRTWVWLNGKLVVDGAPLENYFDKTKPLFPKGPIQLQTHGNEVRWRNIFLREIPAEEANKLLREVKGEGFTPLFNGKDLKGWSGAVENYEVVDGTIRCKPEKGGTLYTTEQYDDFIVRLDFKLPPAGNNGLAIRYPGEGDGAYTGMCELQVLDTEHPNYAKIDPRQAHGSAYGMVASHRGYLRPVGQWNYQQVTVKGSTVKVELNGVTILDTDLSKITEYMANSPHPGKERTKGHFGFAGHSDPVQFRNVSIKKLAAK